MTNLYVTNMTTRETKLVDCGNYDKMEDKMMYKNLNSSKNELYWIKEK